MKNYPRLVSLVAFIFMIAGSNSGRLDLCASESVAPDSGNLRNILELAHKDVKSEKSMRLAANIVFTQEEAVTFWPLYNTYELELSRLCDRRLELLRESFDQEKTLTDTRARTLAEQVFTLEEACTELKRKYFKKFSKVIGPKKATRFFQVESQLNAVIDLRAAAALPPIK